MPTGVVTDIVERTRRREKRLLVAERVWFGALAVLAVVVLLVGSIAAAAARPETCATCHTGEASSLKKDAHRELACDDCHASMSGWRLYGDRLAVVDMVVRQALPGTDYRAAQIDSARCLLCHDGAQMAETVTVDEIKMNHRAPIEKGVPCVVCHPDVGHGRHADRRVGYTMDTCMGCHNASPTNVATCGTCHADDTGGRREAADKVTPWRVTHGPRWKTTHGMGDLATCKGCHGPTFCLRCHDVLVPHAAGYLGTHGREVLALDADRRAACTTCHQPSACSNCHGVPMPHPVDFLKGHAALVKKSGQAVCLRCHAKKSCDECHERHTHPGLESSYLKQLKARPVTPQ